MTTQKRTPREQLAHTFRAACSDLRKGGKLPKGMDEATAARAIQAYGADQLCRLADALEAAAEADDYEVDEGDDEAAFAEFLPGAMPPASATPDQIEKLIAQQDADLARRFGAALLRKVGADAEPDVLAGLARDLEAGEVNAVELVGELVTEARKPKLIKPEPEPKPEPDPPLAQDIADELDGPDRLAELARDGTTQEEGASDDDDESESA